MPRNFWIRKRFIVLPLFVWFWIGLSSWLLAEDPPRSEANLQKIYSLTGDSGFDAKERYDCSATTQLRSIFRNNPNDKNEDPFGMRWRPWLREADRLEKQGKEESLGHIAGVPVRLLRPRGRLKAGVPPYQQWSEPLRQLIASQGKGVADLSRQLWGEAKLNLWPAELSWPPSFLVGTGPYLKSYFDKHSDLPLTYPKRWEEPLQKFLDVSGVTARQKKRRHRLEKVWTWVLSDKIQKNSIVWGPGGQSLLFLSARCFDRVLRGQWRSKAAWQQTLREAVLQEMLQTFYLSARPERFYRDPWIDSVLLAVTQSFLTAPGAFYRHSPLLEQDLPISLSVPSQEDHFKYGAAPVWRFFYQLKGKKFLKHYFRRGYRQKDFLVRWLDKKTSGHSNWLTFATWLLSYPGTTEGLRAELPFWPGGEQTLRPREIKLQSVDPPRGTIGLSATTLAPHSYQFFHFPIRRAEAIRALRLRWQPALPHLSGYLVLARAEPKIPPHFLDVAPIRPGETQEVILNPEDPPTEAYFIAIYSGDKARNNQPIQLQVSVIPRKKLSK